MPCRPACLKCLLPCAVICLSGCGGSGSGPHNPRRKSAPTAYRWLIDTAGSQPSIAQENQHAGTRTWRLPGSASGVGGKRQGGVSGYVSEEAVVPGALERIYVDAAGARRVRIRVFRMGWYGGTGGREVLVSRALRAGHQPPCTHRSATGLTECKWHPTLSFRIPSALPSGVYIAKLSASTGASDVLFVVRASSPQPLLAQLPTSTYQAYNAWGGNSLYPDGSKHVGLTGSTQGVEVSYSRPYASATGAGQFFSRDVAMIRFLERYGYPVSYTTSESVDVDPQQLHGHKALLDFGHSEYWSERQADAFAHARDTGTNLLFLGSDTLGWRVRYAPASSASSEAGKPAHSIVAYKEHAALDPHRSQPTGAFEDRGAGLTGNAFVGCITPRLPASGEPTYRYYSWAPEPGLAPGWLFDHTGISDSTRIPGIVGYEVDTRTTSSPAGIKLLGGGHVVCMHPAAGEPAPGPGQNRADTTLYNARSGAIVFDSGTLGWELALEPVPSSSPDAPRGPDPRIVKVTRNLLDHALGR